MSEQTLKELMSTDILIVHLEDSMQDVYPRLTEQPERFVVVLDDEDVPLYVVTAGEMKRKMPRSLDWPGVGDLAARLAEALLVDEKVTMDQAMVFFGTMSTLEPQPKGLVVVHGDEVVGVLPYKALNGHYNETIVPKLTAKGQTVRAGQPVTVASAVFRCRRHPRCSYEETVSQADRPPLCGVSSAHGHMVLVQ